MRLAEAGDALDLGSSGASGEDPSPSACTIPAAKAELCYSLADHRSGSDSCSALAVIPNNGDVYDEVLQLEFCRSRLKSSRGDVTDRPLPGSGVHSP
jgi:hypothetical protein